MSDIVDVWMIWRIVLGLINTLKRIEKDCYFGDCFKKWKKSLKLVGKLSENDYLCVLLGINLNL
jgi:hypothetical protein